MTEADKLVVLAFQQGDLQVFEAVFKENYPILCRTARRYLVDSADAEEVVQELFIKMWEKRDTLVISTSLPAYLNRAVCNHAINYWKFQKKTVKYQDYVGFEVEEYQTIPADTNLLHNDLDRKITALLKALPEKRRMIFEMSRFEGLKNAQIATQLNINLKTVEYHMSAALDFMRKKLKDYLPVLILILMGL